MMANISFSNDTLQLLAESSFGIADYIVFSLFLCISGAVGIFFSVRGQKDTSEYFLGGKQMKAIPVGISTGVSFMSASSLVGGPAEVYINGYSYVIGVASGSLGYCIGCVTVGKMLQPLQITTINEYIDKRFGFKPLTYVANIIVLLCILEYMGVCMLGSVIALNSVTGGQISIFFGLVIGGVVGIFYTSIGGLKAVVWTDVIQSVVMIAGIVTVIVKSAMDTPGGMTAVVAKNLEYERIHKLTTTTDLTVRHTVWGLLFGFFVYWGVFCIQPASVQRLCSTRTVKDSYIVAVIASALFLVFGVLPCWAGMNIFGYYASRGCDMYAAGKLQNNEIILYYVRERLNYPGFQGLFIAAIFAGSLSSLSSGLNSASAIVWKDTIKPLLKVEVSEMKATFISKMIVVVFGVVSMIWCYTLGTFGGLILQVASSIDASMYGAYMGLVLVGIFFRYMHMKAALVGVIVSFAFTFWLGMMSLLSGTTTPNKLPTATAQCSPLIFNQTKSLNATAPSPVKCKSAFDYLITLSYEWLTLLCIIISLIVSLSVSGCLGNTKKLPNEALLVPALRQGRSRFKCTVDCKDEDESFSSSEEDREELKKFNVDDATV